MRVEDEEEKNSSDYRFPTIFSLTFDCEQMFSFRLEFSYLFYFVFVYRFDEKFFILNFFRFCKKNSVMNFAFVDCFQCQFHATKELTNGKIERHRKLKSFLLLPLFKLTTKRYFSSKQKRKTILLFFKQFNLTEKEVEAPEREVV